MVPLELKRGTVQNPPRHFKNRFVPSVVKHLLMGNSTAWQGKQYAKKVLLPGNVQNKEISTTMSTLLFTSDYFLLIFSLTHFVLLLSVLSTRDLSAISLIGWCLITQQQFCLASKYSVSAEFHEAMSIVIKESTHSVVYD